MSQPLARPLMPLLVLLVLSCMAVGGGLHLLNASHSVTGQTFTVTGKEAVKNNQSSKYLIFTNVTTYEVEDSWLYWRWDSSDVYGRLAVGTTYRATLQGWRIPFFSMYPNIIDPVVVEASATSP